MGITWGAAVALLGVGCSVCSIAAFFIGRRNAVTSEAKEEGAFSADFQYLKDTMRDTSKNVEKLTEKLDSQNKQREKEFRELLVKYTALETKHNLLQQDIQHMKQEIAMYHHHN